MFNNQLIKIIIIVSLLSGAISGIISLIPAVTFFIIIMIMFLTAPFIIIYFKSLNLIKDLSIDQCMITGAVSGFSSFIGFSLIFFPIAFLIHLFFKLEPFIWVKVICQNLLFIIGIVFFAAILSGMLNAFTGFLTGYLYQSFRNK